MIKHFSKLAIAASLFAASLTGCKKDEIRTTAAFSAAPTFSASTADAGVLLLANKTTPAVTFSWSPYTFALSDKSKSASPVTYALQFALAGTNFAKPYELSAGDSTASSSSLTVGQLNSVFISLKATPLQLANIQVRLKTFFANNESFIYSSPVSISATPYDACEPPSADTWSLIGPAGTDWSTDIPMTWSCVYNGYVLTTALKADQFKFRENGAWAVNFGAPTSAVTPVSIGGSALSLSNGGGNLSVAAAGTYTIILTVNGAGSAATVGTVTINQ